MYDLWLYNLKTVFIEFLLIYIPVYIFNLIKIYLYNYTILERSISLYKMMFGIDIIGV